MAPKSKARDSKTVEPTFRLPAAVNGPLEVGRLSRELESINELLLQASLRHKQDQAAPKPSRLLSAILDANSFDLDKPGDRQLIGQYLAHIKGKAPVMHMSFGTDPSGAFIEQIVTWLRKEIHPYALLTIGLQPTVGAGCVLRTTSRFFDMSLKQNFADQRELLTGMIAKADSISEVAGV